MGKHLRTVHWIHAVTMLLVLLILVQFPACAAAADLPLIPTPASVYYLAVERAGIAWRAKTGERFFNACQTVHQLLRVYNSAGSLPAAKIKGMPALDTPGIHEDCGRNQVPTLEGLKRTVERLAFCKMNTYMMCIIQVIPVIESPGQMEELLRRPEYGRLAEVPGGSDLSPVIPESFELLKKMFTEVLPVFDSPYVHLALDETFGIAQGKSKQAVEEPGKSAVIGEWYNKLDPMAHPSRKMIMYSDTVLAHPEIIEMLPQDPTMMFWDHIPRDSYNGVKIFKTAGFALMGLSGNRDWGQAYLNEAFRNMDVMAGDIREHGEIGHFVSSWGDNGGENLNELNWYGHAHCAETSWSKSKDINSELPGMFVRQLYGKDSALLSSANILGGTNK